MASPQRRPRDKGSTAPGNVTAKEWALSNSTTAKFLGGKQKAWMTGQQGALGHASSTNSDIRRSNREIIRQVPERSAQVESTILAACPSENPPPRQIPFSESTSPTVPNSAQQSAAAPESTVCNTDAVLPSPAPSDEVHEENHQAVHFAQGGGVRADETIPPEPNARRLTELAAKYGGIEELEERLRSTEQRETIIRAHLGEGRDIAQVSRRSLSRASFTEESQNKRPRLLPPHSITTPANPSQTSTSDATTAIVGSFNDSSHALSPSATQLLTPPVQVPGLKSLFPAIDSQIHALGGHRIMQNTVEGPRLCLLHDACLQEDYFYIALHQVYCLSSVEPDTASRLPMFGSKQREGLNIVSSLLLPNSRMQQHIVGWFAKFPSQIDTLLLSSEMYQAAYKRVTEWLPYLAQRWQSFKNECYRRQYPPLADELVSHLGVRSETLRRIFSTVIYRLFWVGEEDQCYRRGEEVILQNQRDYRKRLNRLNTASPATAAEIEVQNQQIIIQYQNIYLHHMQHMQHMRQATHFLPTQPSHAPPETDSPMSPPQHVQGSLPRHSHRPPAHVQSYPQSRPTVVRPTSRTNSPSLPLNIDTHTAQRAWSATVGSPFVLPSTLVSAQQTNPAAQCVRPIRSPSVASSPTVGGNSLPAAMQALQSTAIQEPQHHRTWSNQYHAQSPLFQESQSLWTPDARVTTPSGHSRPASQQQRRSSQQRPSPGSALYADSSRPYLPTQASPSFQFDQLWRYAPNQPSRSPSIPQQPNPLCLPLLPPLGYVQQSPTHSNPTSSALHQSYLRSPELKFVRTSKEVKSSQRLFQYVQKLALGPKPLDQRLSSYTWCFSVTAEDYQLRATDTTLPNGAPSQRAVRLGSQTYRLRCFDHTAIGNAYYESQWAVAENTWPPNMLISINAVNIDIRRKLHYGKDLPVDLTPYILEGTNHLQMWIMRAPQERGRDVRYSIGVEVVDIINEEKIKEVARPRDSAVTKLFIQRSMTCSDPDVQIVNDSVTIDLIDPYTARIFDVPARGRFCRHHQCFDFDTFLQTRKGKHPGWPGLPDEWKCPICHADARPQHLVVDGFFIDVREELKRRGRLEDARAIVFDLSGEWRVKEEEDLEESGDGSGRRPSRASTVAAAGKADVRPRQESVVIEIDDD
ncbi:MAG: hypothetical protein LQ347_000522 [Umbilicaria vellea]|nr:MAG: hypothetical protein LQ347_000522 [Umbilicaria vellea]